MATITIPKREYESLKAAKRKLAVLLGASFFSADKERDVVLERAFGIFKKEYGKKTSISYVNKIRKAWRI
jgi:hypothetical protein